MITPVVMVMVVVNGCCILWELTNVHQGLCSTLCVCVCMSMFVFVRVNVTADMLTAAGYRTASTNSKYSHRDHLNEQWHQSNLEML